MGDTGRTDVRIHEDLFVVRGRMAADRGRAANEKLARVAGATWRGSGLRARLGHRLMAIGVLVAGDRPTGRPTSNPGRPS